VHVQLNTYVASFLVRLLEEIPPTTVVTTYALNVIMYTEHNNNASTYINWTHKWQLN